VIEPTFIEVDNMGATLNHGIQHADTRLVAARRLSACLLVVALFAAACGQEDIDQPASPRVVPMGTWVAGLCDAFGRFGSDLGFIAPGDGSTIGALTDASLQDRVDEMVEALRRLRSDVEALGIPDVDGGAALASDVVVAVSRSLAAFEQAAKLRESDSGSVGAVDYPALAYPFQLLSFLGVAAAPGEVGVYIEDPVRDATVARLSRLLERRSDVATLRYESKADACRRFKELFADQEALVDNVDCDALPASFQIELAPGASGSSLRDALIHENGVDDVVVQHVSDIFTQGDPRNLDLDPLRAEAPRHTECTSLRLGAW